MAELDGQSIEYILYLVITALKYQGCIADPAESKSRGMESKNRLNGKWFGLLISELFMQDSQWILQEQIFQKTEGSPKFPIEVFTWRISPYLKKLWNREWHAEWHTK